MRCRNKKGQFIKCSTKRGKTAAGRTTGRKAAAKGSLQRGRRPSDAGRAWGFGERSLARFLVVLQLSGKAKPESYWFSDAYQATNYLEEAVSGGGIASAKVVEYKGDQPVGDVVRYPARR